MKSTELWSCISGVANKKLVSTRETLGRHVFDIFLQFSNTFLTRLCNFDLVTGNLLFGCHEVRFLHRYLATPERVCRMIG